MDDNSALTGQEEAQPDQEISTETAQPLPSMEDLLEQTNVELELPQAGEIREGTIVRVSDAEILVSIGAKSEGVILGRELERIPEEERADIVEGNKIPVYVIKPEDQNGNVLLSYVRARESKDWEWVEGLLKSGETYAGKIGGFNKGGLIVPLRTLRGFLPASQISANRRGPREAENAEARWSKMVGEPIRVRVIEVDQERRRLIVSERAALQESRESLKDKLLDELLEGSVRTGRVTSLAEFGAFVNIDGADGLVHLSEISWDHIEHPGDVLKVGQQVDVKVIAVDRDRKRIGLSIRQLLEDPWVRKAKALKEGQLVSGTVTHLTKFGAFARIANDADLEGLIHISELSEQRITHPKEVVKENDELTLRVIKIDIERRRIGLSLRKVDSAAYADLDWKMALAGEVDGEIEPHAEDEAEEAAETPAAEPPVVETPATETPAAEPPVVEAPAVEPPVEMTDEPDVDLPDAADDKDED